MRFQLNETQQAKLKEWQEAIKTVFGEYGDYTYKFKPTGIGDAVYVYSHLADTEIDLTDVDSW